MDGIEAQPRLTHMYHDEIDSIGSIVPGASIVHGADADKY